LSKHAGSSPTPPPDASVGPDAPPAPAPRVGKLDTLPRVREELTKVYKDARRTAGRDITPGEASRLAFVLQKIGENLIAQQIDEELRAQIDEIRKAVRR